MHHGAALVNYLPGGFVLFCSRYESFGERGDRGDDCGQFATLFFLIIDCCTTVELKVLRESCHRT